MPLSREFMNYVRSYPYTVEGLFRLETDRLRRDPETAKWFEQRMPNATPQERDARIQQQAAMNAQQLGRAAFNEAKAKHGVKQFTPQDLHEAIASDEVRLADTLVADSKILTAAQQAGVEASTAEADYRSKQLPQNIQRQMSMLSPYLPFDETEQVQPATKKPARAVEASKEAEGAPKPKAAAPADDKVLRGLVGVMKDTGAQQQTPAPLAASPVAPPVDADRNEDS